MVRQANVPEAGTITVKIGSVGGTVREVLLTTGATVADALSAAGFPVDSEVRANGETYGAEAMVEDGDSLIVLAGQKPKGA